MLRPLQYSFSSELIYFPYHGEKKELDKVDVFVYRGNRSSSMPIQNITHSSEIKVYYYPFALGKNTIGFNKTLDEYTYLGFFTTKRDYEEKKFKHYPNNDRWGYYNCYSEYNLYDILKYQSPFYYKNLMTSSTNFYSEMIEMYIDYENSLLLFLNLQFNERDSQSKKFPNIVFPNYPLSTLVSLTNLSPHYFRLYYENIEHDYISMFNNHNVQITSLDNKIVATCNLPNEILSYYKSFIEGDTFYLNIEKQHEYFNELLDEETPALPDLLEMLFKKKLSRLLLYNNKWHWIL